MLVGLLGPVNDATNIDQLESASITPVVVGSRAPHAGFLLLSRNAQHVGGLALATATEEATVLRLKMLVGYGL